MSDAELQAYTHVLEPMLTKAPLRHWEGIPWSWVCHTKSLPEAGPRQMNTLWIGRREHHTGTFIAMAGFDDHERHRTVAETLAWDALRLLQRWSLSVSNGRLQPSWLILGAYPGRREALPERWVAWARDTGASWHLYKLGATLGAAGVISLDTRTLETVDQLVSTRGLSYVESLVPSRVPQEPSRESPVVPSVPDDVPVPTWTMPEPKRPRRGRPPKKVAADRKRALSTLSTEWADALHRVLHDLTDSTQRRYRTALEHLVYQVGEDRDRCEELANSGSPLTRSVWRRMSEELSGVVFVRGQQLHRARRPTVLDQVEEKRKNIRAEQDNFRRDHGET